MSAPYNPPPQPPYRPGQAQQPAPHLPQQPQGFQPPPQYPYQPAPQAADGNRNIALIVHLLFAASLLLGVTSIVGVVIAHLKRNEMAGTPYQSHMDYAIRTFWYGFAMGLVTLVLSFLLVGLLLLPFLLVWYIIRIVRPILRWTEGQPIANPTGFF